MQSIIDAAIEKVAEAIWAVEYDNEAYPFAKASTGERNLLLAQASAAIDAMHEMEMC